EGEDPLAPFGPNAKHHVARTNAFPHCPDIMVNSRYWADLDEVAAFEELVGSHGGLGGRPAHPFLLPPPDLQWPETPVVGAVNVHQILRQFLAQLGHEADSSSEPPGATVSARVAEPTSAANSNGGSVKSRA